MKGKVGTRLSSMVLLLAVLWVALGARPTAAAGGVTYVVNSLADTIAGDGIRQRIDHIGHAASRGRGPRAQCNPQHGQQQHHARQAGSYFAFHHRLLGLAFTGRCSRRGSND